MLFVMKVYRDPQWCLLTVSFRTSWFPDLLGLLLWHSGESGEICMRVRLRVYALKCTKEVCWRKEVWTKKGGSIIGFSTARRHNDTAIDSGMSSREQWTNGRAGGCFSRLLIGWLMEAVGLQVAKWTSEHIYPPVCWRTEEGGGVRCEDVTSSVEREKQ